MANQTSFGETSFSVGDTVKVYQKIKEAGKTRLQAFEGIVIGIKGRGENKSFTVRRIGAGSIGVERIWPLISPHLSKIEVMRKGKVRRAKLYYLRGRIGKRATKIKERVEKVEKASPVKKIKESNEKTSTKPKKKSTRKVTAKKETKKAS